MWDSGIGNMRERVQGPFNYSLISTQSFPGVQTNTGANFSTALFNLVLWSTATRKRFSLMTLYYMFTITVILFLILFGFNAVQTLGHITSGDD
jgi:hypothetical protein